MEYFTTDSSITIFALTNKSANAVTVNADSSFFDLVRKFRTALPKLNYVFYLYSAYNLYSKLVEPVNKFISDKEKLYIIPDDIFAYLPFEALVKNDRSLRFDGNFSKVAYLIKDYTISYHYSAELLRETLLHKNDNQQNSFAGFAPVFSDSKNDLNKIASLMDSSLTKNTALRSVIVAGKKYSSLPETAAEVSLLVNCLKKMIIHLILTSTEKRRRIC